MIDMLPLVLEFLKGLGAKRAGEATERTYCYLIIGGGMPYGAQLGILISLLKLKFVAN